jgi:hypothetical protein
MEKSWRSCLMRMGIIDHEEDNQGWERVQDETLEMKLWLMHFEWHIWRGWYYRIPGFLNGMPRLLSSTFLSQHSYRLLMDPRHTSFLCHHLGIHHSRLCNLWLDRKISVGFIVHYLYPVVRTHVAFLSLVCLSFTALLAFFHGHHFFRSFCNFI